MKDLSVVVFTHKNTGSIQRTIDSLKDRVVKNPDIIIGYDDDGDSKYKSFLIKYCEENNYKLCVSDKPNYQNNIINAIKSVKSKYFIFLEHDWEFLQDIDIDKIVNLMNKHNNVNYIKFNKKHMYYKDGDLYFRRYGITHKAGAGTFDIPIEQTEMDGVPLLKIWSYSGNPHIVRTSFFNDTVLPILKLNRHTSNSKDFERPITFLIKRKLSRLGKEKSHKMFGTYIYGKFGDEEYIKPIR